MSANTLIEELLAVYLLLLQHLPAFVKPGIHHQRE